ncbi:hypothetical protein N752_10345 [Desulforamulus aquiferis]|nr:hypothetical protein N752_10345 [Desulforamulus aquiferis]
MNFRSENWPVPTAKIHLAMNSLLPDDVAILKAEEVESEFHARFSAKAKTYRYSIYHHPVMSPLHRLYYYHEPRKLDIDIMKKAAALLLGTHDFKCFQSQGATVKDTIRTIYRAEITYEPPILLLELKGNGFLYNMVRIITGTLCNIGLGRTTWQQMEEIIKSKNRALAGVTAPPHGLSLKEVEY